MVLGTTVLQPPAAILLLQGLDIPVWCSVHPVTLFLMVSQHWILQKTKPFSPSLLGIIIQVLGTSSAWCRGGNSCWIPADGLPRPRNGRIDGLHKRLCRSTAACAAEWSPPVPPGPDSPLPCLVLMHFSSWYITISLPLAPSETYFIRGGGFSVRKALRPKPHSTGHCSAPGVIFPSLLFF